MNSNFKTSKDLLLLTIIIGLLFTLFLGSRPLMVPDEGRYAEIPREMIAMGDYVTPHINYIKYFEKPPLHYWLQTVSLHLFGFSNFSVRLMTALLGLLGCLMTYYAGSKLYNRLTGWLAALILATSGLYFEMARFITLDMAVTVFLTGALFSFLLGTQTAVPHRRYYMWAMYIFSALAMLTKGLIGIIFPGMIIFVWLLVTKRWRELKTYCIPSGILLWLAITLPWHIAVQLRNPEFFKFYFITQQFSRYLTTSAHREAPFWVFPILVIAGFFPWIFFLIQSIRSHWPKPWQNRLAYPKELFLFLWPLLIFLFFQFSHSKLPPYILPIFPPLAVLVGHFLAQKWMQSYSLSDKKVIFTVMIIIFLLSLGAAIFAVITQHLYALFILPIVIAIILWRAVKAQTWQAAIIGIILCMMPILISADLLIGGQAAHQKSIYPLAASLKNRLKANDIVVNYHGYNQDLPYYLQRRVVIAGWGNSELEFGMSQQNMQNWFWTNSQLWQMWANPNQQIFLFMSKKDYNALTKNSSEPLYLLGQTQRNVLVTNVKP